MRNLLWSIIFFLSLIRYSFALNAEETPSHKTDLTETKIPLEDALRNRFDSKKSRCPTFKKALADKLSQYYLSQLEQAQNLLKNTQEKINSKDLFGLEDDLRRYTQTLISKNTRLVSEFQTERQSFKENYALKGAIFDKYMKRFVKMMALMESLLCESIKHAFKELVDPIDYIKFYEIQKSLLKKGIISKDHYYIKSKRLPTFQGECSICFETSTKKNPLVKMTNCPMHLASYCRACLAEYIQISLKEKAIWSIKCPDKNCIDMLSSCDVLALFDVSTAGQFMKESLHKLQRESRAYFICTNEACYYNFTLRQDDEKYFYCSSCDTRYCYDCGIKSPIGDICTQHCQFESLSDLIDMQVIQICDSCHQGVVRVNGCSDIVCACGNQIDYRGNFREIGTKNWNWVEEKIYSNTTSYPPARKKVKAIPKTISDEDSEDR